jgi:hypothetical protein
MAADKDYIDVDVVVPHEIVAKVECCSGKPGDWLSVGFARVLSKRISGRTGCVRRQPFKGWASGGLRRQGRLARFSVLRAKGPELLSEDDLKPLLEDADIDGQLTDYRRKGHKAELTGHDSVEGTDCYKIKLTMKNGDIRYYYLDIDSFLELKIETQRMIRGAVEYRDTIYGDYEEVNGLYFPFAFESGEKGDPNRLTARVDKIEINVPLTDHRFSMPAGNPNTKASGAAKWSTQVARMV